MTYSRYYRFKLSTSQKGLYDELLKKIKERQNEIRLGSYSTEELQIVLFALNFDNPDLYYVDFKKIKILKTTLHSSIFITYYCDRNTQISFDNKIKNVTNSILKTLNDRNNKDYSLALHDWLVSNCTYGECDMFPNASHSIIGALLFSKCVCEGYAKAYKYLADLIKLRCIVITGKGIHPDGSEGGHAWNIIKEKNNFYHVDVTFDLLFANRYCSRAYYMLSTKEILHDHSIDDSFELPICTHSGSILRVVSGTSELLMFLENEYKKKVTYSEVRLTKGFTKDKLMAMIHSKLSMKDMLWFNHIESYWYGDYCRTLFVCWR